MHYIVRSMKDFCFNTIISLKRHFTQRFRVLNMVLGILCFLILPGMIILRGIDGIIALETHKIKQSADQKLQELLDQLEFFSANDRFAHFLLSSLCTNSRLPNADPGKLLAGINSLKSRFPDSFTFVVADQNGNLLPDLSDEKEFSYLFRQAFKLIDEVRTAFEQGNAGEIAQKMDGRLTRLKPLLGDMLKAENLLLPLRGKRVGRSILASGSAGKFHLWFGTSGRFQLIVFINRTFIRGKSGLQWASNMLNRKNPETITGFTEFPPDSASLFPNLPDDLATRIIIALASNEEMHNVPDATQISGPAVACRFLNQTWRGFALFRQKGLTDPASIKATITAQAIKFLLVFLFVLFVYQLRNPVSITVKLKIAAFFSYAIILPLLVIASLTMQYVSQSEAEMMNELKNEAFRTIEKLDAHYDWFLQHRAESLTRYLVDKVETNPELLQHHDSLVQLHEDLKKIANPGEVMMADSSGIDFFQGISHKISRDRSLIHNAGMDILKIFISGDLTNASRNASHLVMMLHTDMYKLQNKISYLGIGDFELSIFYRMLQPRGGDISKLIFSGISWELHRLQREHVADYCRTELASAENMQIAAFCRVEEELFMSPQEGQQQLIRLMNMSVNRRITQITQMKLNGKGYIAVAMPGRKLSKLILAALLPIDNILRQREILVTRARFAGMFLCLLTMATMYLLQSWIFRPLEELKAGISAIANRKFNKRLDLVCQNEFGKLMAAFNHSLETLQELEVARIVQESILPETRLVHNRIEVVAQSMTMKNLGGDYFDMIPLDDHKVIILIGDATGHGIPAALSMAMAKAIIIHELLRGMEDLKLMQQINSVFSKLRARGSKDFMTALCVQIDSSTGCGRIINAGHCFPILYKGKTGEATLLSAKNALPPGFDPEPVFIPATFRLESGDSLALFTDGFVECLNNKGLQIGFNGLAELIATTACADTADHIARIFQKLSQWSAERQDDCTMVMVRFK